MTRPPKTHRLPFRPSMVRAEIRGDKTMTRRRQGDYQPGDTCLHGEPIARTPAGCIRYVADGEVVRIPWRWKVATLHAMYLPATLVRRRSIIVAHRVEPLADITEADALAEGMFPVPNGGWYAEDTDTGIEFPTARDAWLDLISRIYHRSWVVMASMQVSAITFARLP